MINGSGYSQCGNNLLQNPGFESIVAPCSPPVAPDLVNAAFNSNCVPFWQAAWGTPSVCTEFPVQGPYYGCLGANYEGFYQQVDICAGYFDLSFQYRKLGSGADGEMRVYMANGLTNQGPGHPGATPMPVDPSWQLITAVQLADPPAWQTFTASGITIQNPLNNQLLFLIVSSACDGAVDDVVFGPSTNAAAMNVQIGCSNQQDGNFHFSIDAMDAPPGFVNGVPSWDFGDGNTGSGENVAHTYASEGTYNVCVTFEDGCGCDYTICREANFGMCYCDCVADETPPLYSTFPQDITVSCNSDITAQFYAWVQTNGNSSSYDECTGIADRRAEWEGSPGTSSCIPFPVHFSLEDSCGNHSMMHTAYFTVIDNSSPMLTSFPSNLVKNCEELTIEEVQTYLDNHGGGQAVDNCSAMLTWSYIFSGDLTQDSVPVIFRVTNQCNLTTSFQAWIIQTVTNDTLRFTATSCNPASMGSDTTTMIAGLCTTVHIFDTLLVQADTTILTPDFCRSGTIENDTMLYTNVDGCDSLVFIHYNIIPPDTITFFANTCDPAFAGLDTVLVNGPQCDTIHITITTLQPSDTIRMTIPVCDPSLVDVDTVFLQNQLGCDSLIITGSVFNDPTRRDTLLLCGNMSDFLDTVFIPALPCDSIIIRFHDFSEPDTTHLFNTTCFANEAGEFTEVLTNVIGCDSVVIETIDYAGSDTTFLDNFTCIESEAGVFTDDLLNINGCDSIVVNTVIYMGIDTILIQSTSCDPAAIDTFISISTGPFCDTVRIYEITFDPVFIHRDTMIVCALNGPATDTLFFTSIEGCDSLSITHFEYQFVMAEFLITDEVCEGYNDGMIEILNISGATPPYLLSINSDLPGSETLFTGLAPGNYNIAIQDANGCENMFIDLMVNVGDQLTLTLPADTIIEEGQILRIASQYSHSIAQWQWSATDPLNCPDCPEIRLGPIVADQWVFVFATSTDGCPGQDSMFIEVVPLPDWIAPNVFTPNDDGINDFFSISLNRQDIFVSRLQVFDRWGSMVFNQMTDVSDQAKMTWDGKFKDQTLPPGVFAFRAEIKIPGRAEPVRYTGDVTLVR